MYRGSLRAGFMTVLLVAVCFSMLGLGSAVDVTVLEPGETGQIALEFRTTEAVATLTLSTITEAHTGIPWDEVEAEVQPEDADPEAEAAATRPRT